MSDDAARAIADAIADGFEAIILKLTGRIATLETRADAQLQAIEALSNRIEAVGRTLSSRTDHLA